MPGGSCGHPGRGFHELVNTGGFQLWSQAILVPLRLGALPFCTFCGEGLEPSFGAGPSDPPTPLAVAARRGGNEDVGGGATFLMEWDATMLKPLMSVLEPSNRHLQDSLELASLFYLSSNYPFMNTILNPLGCLYMATSHLCTPTRPYHIYVPLKPLTLLGPYSFSPAVHF